MIDDRGQSGGGISPGALGVMILLAGGLMLAYLTGASSAWLGAFYTVLIEGSTVLVVVAAAGGLAWPVVRRLAPDDAPVAFLVLTACGLGLWMLSTAVLLVGSLTTGLLKAWVWWPVLAVGVLLAGWFGRKTTARIDLAGKFEAPVLVWVLVAATVGIALAGATRPPASWGVLPPDEYDVLEYHLQVPREFYDAQHIGQMRHNVYSYYPLGVEMLFLLSMVLRGGAYEGMYLAKFVHLAFGGLAVAAVFCGLMRQDRLRGRLAAGLLATTPFAVYLAWLAMVELAQVFYLAMALLWVLHWLKNGSLRSAICTGLMLGAACATKYLAVGLVAGPVLVAMLLVGLRRIRCIWQVVPAVLVTILLMSPWLIRNMAYTADPVFPLATTVFGRGHWSAESQRRWIDGHEPGYHPPVPIPPQYQPPADVPTRAEMFVDNLLLDQRFGQITLVLAALGICVWIARSGPTDLFAAALIATLAAQLTVWIAFTRNMPGRFIVPAAVPMVLLAAGVLADLARVRRSPFRHIERNTPVPWGVPPAMILFIAAVGINLLVCVRMYKALNAGMAPVNGVSGADMARLAWPWKEAHELPAGSKLMLVGDAKAFYFPTGTVYATAFDEHPLAEWIEQGLSPDRIRAELRGEGITHVWVDWYEIARLAGTYGYPASLRSDLLQRARTGGPFGSAVFEWLGLTVVKHLMPPAPTTEPGPAPTSGPTTKPASAPTTAPLRWPYATIYAVPSEDTAGGR